jgi:hypothetical protein
MIYIDQRIRRLGTRKSTQVRFERLKRIGFVTSLTAKINMAAFVRNVLPGDRASETSISSNSSSCFRFRIETESTHSYVLHFRNVCTRSA